MMIVPSGDSAVDKLHQSATTVIYRGKRQSDQAPVILKLLKPEYSTLADQVRLCNHYQIATQLNLPGIVRPIALESAV